MNETSYIQFECQRVFKAGKVKRKKVHTTKYKEWHIRYLQHVFYMKVWGAGNLKHFNQARCIKCMEFDQWHENTWSPELNVPPINTDVEVRRNWLEICTSTYHIFYLKKLTMSVLTLHCHQLRFIHQLVELMSKSSSLH